MLNRPSWELPSEDFVQTIQLRGGGALPIVGFENGGIMTPELLCKWDKPYQLTVVLESLSYNTNLTRYFKIGNEIYKLYYHGQTSPGTSGNYTLSENETKDITSIVESSSGGSFSKSMHKMDKKDIGDGRSSRHEGSYRFNLIIKLTNINIDSVLDNPIESFNSLIVSESIILCYLNVGDGARGVKLYIFSDAECELVNV